ncbi:unknown similar to AMEV099 [Choristoneura rosaceana entomopoxvirus 'L']|uniref:Uncharacterized protein n=1 Tax=Choristoneura rosaceana entomopoxvirus 'L' TaxID=1293539 RepID=A0ABM9QKG5_9POXV|nr:unknown similar to AMEV099 [Choristoneura rosaceana entomopoxvirus 'L']CCU56024.1 unknown similar to AMEV099 [Choristoneura rosaceana entomopoxvirus 'L']
MEHSYVKLASTIIKSLNSVRPDLVLKPINYDDDEMYIERIFINGYMKENDFREFDDKQWISSMQYIYLKLFSFFNNKTGTLKFVYDISHDDDKKILLSDYKDLINKLNINILKQKIICKAKEEITISESINYKINNIIRNISNYKEPTFIANLIDLFFYDEEIRKIFIEIINNYIPYRSFDNCNNDYYTEEARNIMILMMNINVGTTKCTQEINDYINTFISKLFDTSEFLNKCILSFKNDSCVKFKCCSIKKASNIYECDNGDLSCIKYNENTSGYKPLHIRLHIIHILIKILNIFIYCYKNNIYDKYKTKINNSDFNNKFSNLKDILNINLNDKIDIANIFSRIYDNREQLSELYDNNKDNIKKYLKEQLSTLELSQSIKNNIYDIIDSSIDEINFNNIPDINKDMFNEKIDEVKTFMNDKVKPILNIINKKFKKV